MRPTGQHELTLRASAGLGLPSVEAPVVTSAYYDVPGGSLAEAGIVLLRRTDGGRSIWELRLPAEESCLELEEDGAQGQPPSSVPKLLQAHLRHGPLERIAELRTQRSRDLVEVELELRSASPAHIGLLARELHGGGGGAVPRGEGRVFRCADRGVAQSSARAAARDRAARPRDTTRSRPREPARHARRPPPHAGAAARGEEADLRGHVRARRAPEGAGRRARRGARPRRPPRSARGRGRRARRRGRA